MAKSTTQFSCQECGAITVKWVGQCPSCGEWNSLIEEQSSNQTPGGLGKTRAGGKGRQLDFVTLDGPALSAPRLKSGNQEFDRVAGGGLVPGSAILIGGDPGIGKSTLLLQIAARIAEAYKDQPTLYISGEEAVDQVRMRAQRLGVVNSPVRLATATNTRDIMASIDVKPAPALAIIDSIQTMFVDTLDSAPGTVSQVKASALELIRLAKKTGTILFIVGHVTKDGAIAGPRVLEHMVDTVLYFEGDRGHQFRILRSVKNRFGATDEIGVFEMAETGLAEVPNPSALFLADRQGPVSGACVFAGMEGSRPVLMEIQALLAPTTYGNPRRAVVGWDSNRLAMIMAVLETRCGVQLSGHDVYLNVAGGLKIAEPAADIAVAAALISSLSDRPIAHETVFFGEIGLSGEVRSVGQRDARLKEAQKLGFGKAVLPHFSKKKNEQNAGAQTEISIKTLNHVSELVDWLQDRD